MVYLLWEDKRWPRAGLRETREVVPAGQFGVVGPSWSGMKLVQ